MPDVSRLKFIYSSFCTQYQSEAKFYIDEAHASGLRHLVVAYEKGGYAGHPNFAAGIPDKWSEQDLLDLILWPMKDPKSALPRVGGASARLRQSDAVRVVAGRPGPD